MALATNAWMNYVDRAVGALHPNMRPGYDFTWGRRVQPYSAEPGDAPPPPDPEMLHWSDKLQPADMGAIQAKAQEFAEADPNAPQEPEGGGGNGGGETAPAAPTVTPIAVTAPVAVGTPVADITGEGTYAVVTGAGQVSVSGTQLQAAAELSTDTPVGVTATNAAGTSPEGTATITMTPAGRREGGTPGRTGERQGGGNTPGRIGEPSKGSTPGRTDDGSKTDAERQGRVEAPRGAGRSLGDDIDPMITGGGEGPTRRTEEDDRRDAAADERF